MYKGIIESVQQKSAIVRIPEFNKIDGAVGSTPSNELSKSIICTLPGYIPNLRAGDVVLVAFENFDPAKPIIMGLLYTDKVSSCLPDIYAGSVNVSVNGILPEDTSIGEVTPESIKCLLGLERNAQTQFNELFARAKKLQEQIDIANILIAQLQESVKKAEETLKDVNTRLGKLEDANLPTRVETLETNVKKLDTDINDNSSGLKKKVTDLQNNVTNIENRIDPIILTNKSYGSTLPNATTAKAGQLFFKIEGQ